MALTSYDLCRNGDGEVSRKACEILGNLIRDFTEERVVETLTKILSSSNLPLNSVGVLGLYESCNENIKSMKRVLGF